MENIIHESYNYNVFSKIDFNRSICKKNLEKLIELNKKKDRFHLFPIVVDTNHNIIDGQHRFEACKQMQKPIYYVVDHDQGETWAAITEVNTAGKTHSATDVYYMLLKKNDEIALKIDRVSKCYPTITPGSLCYYFITNYKTDKSVLRMLQKREHKISDFDFKYEVLKNFYSYFGYFKNAQCKAMCTVLRKIEVKKVEKYFNNIKKKGFAPEAAWSVSTFKENLIKVHNKGLHKNRLAL